MLSIVGRKGRMVAEDEQRLWRRTSRVDVIWRLEIPELMERNQEKRRAA